MLFTINHIARKSYETQGLLSYVTFLGLVESPDEFDNYTIKKYKVFDNKFCENRFKYALHNEFLAGWANTLNLKCKPANLRQFMGKKITKTNKIIDENLINLLEQSEKKGCFGILFCDIDDKNCDIDQIKKMLGLFFNSITNTQKIYDYLIYATKSSKIDKKRWRVIIPLKRFLNIDKFIFAQTQLQKILGSDIATAVNPYQSFMLPLRINNDYMEKSHYAFHIANNGQILDAYNIIYEKANNPQKEPISPKKEYLKKLDNIMHVFNNTFPVDQILERNNYVISSSKYGKKYVGEKTPSSSSIVFENTGRFMTFKSNSKLFKDGKSLSSFDVFCVLECENNYKIAYKKARNLVGNYTGGI